MSQLSDKIDRLFAERKWKAARALIEKAIAKRGDAPGHWLLARLATTHYEERKYSKALELIEEARKLAPRCPLVLWDYSGILLALGRTREAIEVCLSLLKRGPLAIARDECGEGEKWAVSLLTDCLFRVGVCLKLEHEWDKARQFFAGYVDVVDAGAASIYLGMDLYKHLTEMPPRGDETVKSSKERSPQKRLQRVRKQVLRLVG